MPHNSHDAPQSAKTGHTLDHRILAVLAPKSTDRSERYCARLDEHLATLANDRARYGFLVRELANWQERYRVWAAGIDSGRIPLYSADGPTANDYILTITEIGTRQARYQPAAVAP